MAKKAALKINESALIKNLKFAFSNSFTVLTELLQNARRAGATKVDISAQKENGEMVLIVVDNGIGISDFQKLLTVAESGWDEKLVQEESAFGMGFLGAIFAARRVVVQSNGHTMDIDTEHLLSMNDVTILPVAEHLGLGASVTLFGVNENIVEERTVEELVKGFPLPVTLNGKNIERPRAMNGGLSFIDTPVGSMSIKYEEIANHRHMSNTSFVAYLQGFKVIGDSRYDRSVVLHLDSTRFKARMPDRDKLIDERDAEKQIANVISHEMRRWLESKLEELGTKKFFDRYGDYVTRNFRDMLNKSGDVLPACVLSRPDVVSKCSERHQCGSGRDVTREEIASGKVLLFADPAGGVEDEENEAFWQFIYHYDDCFIVDGNLPKDHWAAQYIQEAEGNDDVVVVPVEEGKSADFNGSYVYGIVVLCKEVHLTCAGATAVVSNFAIYAPGDRSVIFAPGESPDVENVLQVISGYYDSNDYFDEGSFNDDQVVLARLVRNLRSQDFSKAVAAAIESEEIAMIDGAAGKQFLVQFAKDPQRHEKNVVSVDLGKVLAKLGIGQDELDAALKSVLDEQQVVQEQ